jgi:uncharacterized protein (TIGR03663 family)
VIHDQTAQGGIVVEGAARSRSSSLSLSRVTAGDLVFFCVVVLALVLRLWDVGARAMHLDESTVAWFGWQLATGHGYAYDPVYHGPFQHEILALLFLIFQASETVARLPAVVFGTALVALPWFIRDYLGRPAALGACFLLAISPSFVYFARFERDDTYMEFFTLLIVVLVLRFARDRRPWQMYALGLVCALAFATKESSYIVTFIFVSYLLLNLGGTWLRAHILVPPALIGRTGSLSSLILVAAAVLMLAAAGLTLLTGLYVPVPLVAFLLLASMAVAAGTNRRDDILAPVRSFPAAQWISVITIALAVTLLMYSTFGTNLNGLWDRAHPFFNTNHACTFPLPFQLNACRKDIAGGLLYWLSQHKVARGGQPWFYFGLIDGLYEQLALLLGAYAILGTLLRQRMSRQQRSIRVFLTYWTLMAYGIYSWAGEKFPWLGIHPLLPLTLLAGIGLADMVRQSLSAAGQSSLPRSGGKWPLMVRRSLLLLAAVLVVIELHNTFLLNYVNGANPVEMMVYVQSAPSTASDARRIELLSNRATNGPTLAVTIDSTDSWPFAWYLRGMPNAAYPASASVLQPPYGKNPVILIDQSNADSQTLPAWLTRGYTRIRHRLDWWFPEDYKTWSWSSLPGLVSDPGAWQAILKWELYRRPFGPRDGSWYYLYVKKGYFSAF